MIADERSSLARRLAVMRAVRRRRRRRHFGPRRRIPSMSVVPTLFTLGNLVAGFAAIHYAAKPLEFTGLWGWSSLTIAGALVFLGMFLDSVDGSVARLMRTSSELGAQLDSLADVVTFGVAPAFMMLQLVSQYVGPTATLQPVMLGPEADNAWAKLLWGIAAVYTCCTALRLARFNVETPSAKVEDHLVFRGLPSPGAAGCVASLIVLHQHYVPGHGAVGDDVTQLFARVWALGVPLIALGCALMMVSNVPFVHMTNRYVRGQKSYRYVVRVVVLLALTAFFPQQMLAIAFTVYAISGPIRAAVLWVRKRKAPATGAATGARA